MSRWTSEITNDPQQGYALVVELLEGDVARARIERDAQAGLVLRVYGDGELRIPVSWLRDILEQAQMDAVHLGNPEE